MKMKLLESKKSSLLFWLCFFSVLCSAGSESQLQFDPDGQFVSATGQVELRSYAMEDLDVNFDEVLKLDTNLLFQKGADLSGGIKGTIGSGGHIDTKLYAYDVHEDKHLIYHIRLTESSPSNYSEGERQTVKLEPPPQLSTSGFLSHSAKGTEIKTLLQNVNDAYVLTKEDLERTSRAEYAVDDQQRRTRELRGGWGFLVGITVGVLLGAAYVGFTVATGGAGAITAAVVVPALYAAVIGGMTGFVLEDVGKKIFGPDDNPAVETPGTLTSQSWADLPNDEKLVPIGAYPVHLLVQIKDASLTGIKIPGVGEVLPGSLEIWNTYSPAELNNVVANNYFWYNAPGHMLEENPEITGGSSLRTMSSLESDDYTSFTRVKLTVNPGAQAAVVHTFGAGASWPANAPAFTMGDHLLWEIVMPTNQSFDEVNPQHYPELSGFPYAWLAHFSGEVLYQCNPSIQPGEWRPWIGFDSQVHGTILRRYPSYFDTKFNPWEVDTSHSGYVIYRWLVKLNRRMDDAKTSYTPVHDWPKRKTTPVTQRNNQKEGLNMELFRTWKTNTTASTETPDFASYNGPPILPGLDPDEFLYLRDASGVTTDIITLDGEPWKTVPTDEAHNPINDIVTAYKKNRMWHVDNTDYRNVHGANYSSANYEIQDLGTGAENPDGTGIGNNVAPGRVTVKLPEIAAGDPTVRIAFDVNVPLETDKGFYGNISGELHPAVYEKGFLYTVTGLKKNQVSNYGLSFIYEDNLGNLKYLEFLSSEMPDHIRNGIKETGEWLVVLPFLLGYGYYSVNLWYKNPNYADSWTRIGGRELLDINLRFLSVPGSLAGATDAGYPGVDLKESPGDGAFIYLDEFLDNKRTEYQLSKFSRYAENQARTYVFEKGNTSTFEVFDADPHTFVHRGTEWYLSERFQAKRITDAQLADKLRFYVDPIKSNGQVVSDTNWDGSGKKFTKQWNETGVFQLKASYNGTTSVAHRIVVVDPDDRAGDLEANIAVSPLTSEEQGWLQTAGVTLSQASNWQLLSLIDLDSQYRYINGPRMHTDPNQVNRFHPGNDYADSYQWKVNLSGAFSSYDLGSSLSPTGLSAALSDFDDGAGWMPNAFVRHTSEKSLKYPDFPQSDNNPLIPMPADIAKSSISVSRFSSLSANQTSRIQSLFTDDLPEAWQVRLPWISFVTDPAPYQSGENVYSYRTRTNIKVIYNMNAFFDNDTGAFSGNVPDPTGGDSSYENMVQRGLYLHLKDDDTKLKNGFFLDLATGRSVIVPSSVTGAKVANIKENDTVIAQWD